MIEISETGKPIPELDLRRRIAAQVKLASMMSYNDFIKWTDRFAGYFDEALKHDPELAQRIYDEMEQGWDIKDNKESRLLREVADTLQAMYDIGKEVEPDEETLTRAS